MNNYQLIIIGAGSGGLVAAELAAKLGVKVALVEAKQELGGECLHSGCVPSKSLIHVARSVWQAGHSQSIGLRANLVVDFNKATEHIQQSIDTITSNHDNDDYYQQLGVEMFHGKASFINSQTIIVNGRQLKAKRFIIATGSIPAIPTIPGLANGDYLTNETIFKLNSLPASLAVIGGGPIGCELGQAFAMLGSQVTIVQSSDRLLPRDEIEASALLGQSFEKMGIRLALKAEIMNITFSNDNVEIKLKDNQLIVADKLLVATGRQATIPAGLETAGVEAGARGIKVNSRMQSTNKHIYAIGDCNGGLQFTHAAAQQAIVAVKNALGLSKQGFDSSTIPWTTFTTPEIAHLGEIKADLDEKKLKYNLVRANFSDIDKAITEKEEGFIEILIGQKNKILSATVVGVNAAEILAQVVTAKSWKNFAGIVQAYPTYAGGLRQTAGNYNFDKLLTSSLGKVIKNYIKLRNK